ncbi:MAG: hypothetical protein M3256_20500 [Actinomycetota bacterium]|nr:hypothetical protein [Actinomycetota bacterium]
MSLNNLSNSLAALGRQESTVEAGQEAVDLYRQLAQARPDAFLPDLAISLQQPLCAPGGPLLPKHLDNVSSVGHFDPAEAG